MPVTRAEALSQLASLQGLELAKAFCDLVPKIEDDDLLFDLLGLFAGAGELPEGTVALAWILISLVNYKRQTESELAEMIRSKPCAWMARGQEIASVDDVVGRDGFRRAVTALARSALV